MTDLSELKTLSNGELRTKVASLAAEEERLTLESCLHMAELNKRRLYLELGFSSMFDYLTGELNFSSSAAVRRIQIVKVIGEHPEALELLKAKKLSLTSLAIGAELVLKDGPHWLTLLAGKSTREVEECAKFVRATSGFVTHSAEVIRNLEKIASLPEKAEQAESEQLNHDQNSIYNQRSHLYT